jgi:hypothetical protein
MVTLKCVVFRTATWCSMVEVSRRLGVSCCPSIAGNIFLIHRATSEILRCTTCQNGTTFGRVTVWIYSGMSLAQLAMLLTCGVEVFGSNFGRDLLRHEIFLTFLTPLRENIYVAPEWLRPLSPRRSHLGKAAAVSCNWTLF